MKSVLPYLPLVFIFGVCVLLCMHGPITQPARYHEFADRSVFAGIQHSADVLSNLGFLAVATWGIFKLWPVRRHVAMQNGWAGYALFLAGMLLTAFGSSYYHLSPNNQRLVWDRLPIALACAGLLAAVRAETVSNRSDLRTPAGLAAFAIASVAWWSITDKNGAGDLRPYLLLQGMPLILVPMWQAIYRSPRADRLAFGAALLLYVAAKVAELNDHELLAKLGVVSGHTIKHLLATAAAWVLVARLVQRVRRTANGYDSTGNLTLADS